MGQTPPFPARNGTPHWSQSQRKFDFLKIETEPPLTVSYLVGLPGGLSLLNTSRLI